MKQEPKFNVVIATYEDGISQIATAINNNELIKLTPERLEQILEIQRITLLEKGDKASKEEAIKIGSLIVEYKDAEVIFQVAKQPIEREEYVQLYKLFGDEELEEDNPVMTNFAWEAI